MTLCKSNENCNWHIFTVSILEVLNVFMKNLFITKYSDFKLFLVNGQTSKHYSRTGRHLLLTSCNRTLMMLTAGANYAADNGLIVHKQKLTDACTHAQAVTYTKQVVRSCKQCKIGT